MLSVTFSWYVGPPPVLYRASDQLSTSGHDTSFGTVTRGAHSFVDVAEDL